jgi:hypothetical protein
LKAAVSKTVSKAVVKDVAHLNVAVHEPQAVDVGQSFQALHCYTRQSVWCEVHPAVTATAASTTAASTTVTSNSCSVRTQPFAKLVQVLLQQLAHYEQVLLRIATV